MQWLVEDSGADPNPVDRFGRTPLEDAVRESTGHVPWRRQRAMRDAQAYVTKLPPPIAVGTCT